MATTKTTDIEALLERCRYDGPATEWSDIIGHDPAMRELAVIAEQYRRSSVAERLGLTLAKGVLIMSVPGAGKTMLARALAGSVTRAIGGRHPGPHPGPGARRVRLRGPGEELLRGPEHVTMGCSSDVAKATGLLRDLVAGRGGQRRVPPTAGV